MTTVTAFSPDYRRATKAAAATFFDVALPTISDWVRKGAPVVKRGKQGVGWELDLKAIAEWRYGSSGTAGDIDPEKLSPAERKAWYEGETRRVELLVRATELLSASETDRAIATAIAALGHDIRAIPDNLERQHGVSAEVAEFIEVALLEAMNTLADRLSVLGSNDQQNGEGGN